AAYERIEVAVAPYYRAHRALDLISVAGVGRERQPPHLRGKRLERLGSAAHQPELPAALGESASDRGADATPPAGDQRAGRHQSSRPPPTTSAQKHLS